MPRNFYNLPGAWNPGYAIPAYAMDEPVGRGTFTTAQLPRGTISQVPRDLAASYNPHFAVPAYIQAEPYGQGTFTTDWIPRGTISQGVPEFGMASPARKLLGRDDSNLGSLGDDTLGAAPAPARDPIGSYGQTAASWIIHTLARVPADQRSDAMHALLDAVDTSLWGTVENARTKLERQGLTARAALQQALATSMSQGMLAELVKVGKRAQRGQRALPSTGHVALGASRAAGRRAKRQAFQALGFSFGDLNPVNLVRSGLNAIDSVTSVVTKPIGQGVDATGSGVKTAAVATANFVADGIDTLGSLACSVIKSDAYKAATQAAATAAGGPAGGTGAGVGIDVQRGICGGGQKTKVTLPPPKPAAGGLPAWLMPAALGVGIFGVGALLLRRK